MRRWYKKIKHHLLWTKFGEAFSSLSSFIPASPSLYWWLFPQGQFNIVKDLLINNSQTLTATSHEPLPPPPLPLSPFLSSTAYLLLLFHPSLSAMCFCLLLFPRRPHLFLPSVSSLNLHTFLLCLNPPVSVSSFFTLCVSSQWRWRLLSLSKQGGPLTSNNISNASHPQAPKCICSPSSAKDQTHTHAHSMNVRRLSI